MLPGYFRHVDYLHVCCHFVNCCGMVTIHILIEGGVLIDVEVCLPFHACVGTFALYILPFRRCLIYYCIVNELLVCKNSDILLAYIYNSFYKNILYYIFSHLKLQFFFFQSFRKCIGSSHSFLSLDLL